MLFWIAFGFKIILKIVFAVFMGVEVMPILPMQGRDRL